MSLFTFTINREVPWWPFGDLHLHKTVAFISFQALGLEAVEVAQGGSVKEDGVNVTDLECEEVCAMPPKK